MRSKNSTVFWGFADSTKYSTDSTVSTISTARVLVSYYGVTPYQFRAWILCAHEAWLQWHETPDFNRMRRRLAAALEQGATVDAGLDAKICYRSGIRIGGRFGLCLLYTSPSPRD